MNRRSFMSSLGGLVVIPLAGAMPGRGQRGIAMERMLDQQSGNWEPLRKSEEEWKGILTPEEFQILRKEGTEPAFSSALNDEKRPGTYICAGCFLPLFSSRAKFDSGTGWPSFTEPLEGSVRTKLDFKLIWPRREYHCARCGGHQGHVFNDGPQPTGQRWCNNGVALNFVPEGQELPEMRP